MTSENPASEIQVPKLGKRLPKALSVAEIELLAAPDREDPIGLRDAALVELLYGTGARISEITISTSTTSPRPWPTKGEPG